MNVKELIQETVDETIVKLKKAALLQNNEQRVLKKTEKLLKMYNDLKVVDPEPGSATEIMLERVELAFAALEGDEYEGLIAMIYLEGKTREECAEYYGVEPITITRNKKRLLDIMKNIIFSDDTIRELFL